MLTCSFQIFVSAEWNNFPLTSDLKTRDYNITSGQANSLVQEREFVKKEKEIISLIFKRIIYLCK